MDRVYDPYLFHGTVAAVDWAVNAREQKRQPSEGNLTAVLQLRWLVSTALGVPPRPFTVWRRESEVKTQDVETIGELAAEGFVAQVLPEPMTTVDVDVTPDTPGGTVLVAGFAETPRLESLAAVATATPATATTLRVRASGIRYLVVTGGSVSALRAESVRDALAAQWKAFELVGLPVDNSWGASTYDSGDQGLLDSPQPPGEAARERLVRGLAPFGWPATTGAGRAVPDWVAPDPAGYVAAVQAGTLAQALPLFEAGVQPVDQAAIRPVTAVPGPTSRGRTAPGDSTTAVPLLGTLLVGPGNESAAALALGFGTAYPITDLKSVEASFPPADVLVTATFPDGVDADRNPIEYAVVLPWPAARQHPPGAPTALGAERAGLLLPENDAAPWTETIRVSFGRLTPSVALDRPTVGALARYDAAPGPAELVLEPDPDAGGWRPLLLAARPAPNAGQVALVDSVATDLPLDLSPRTLGHAVSVADVYGAWSPWSDVDFSSAAPPYPIPQVVSAHADAAYGGSTTCPAVVTADIVIDWQTRTPATVELRVATCPVGYAGAPLPAGTGPWGVPPGCTLRSVVLAVAGGQLIPAGPGVEVAYLTADGSASVDPGAPDFPAGMQSPSGDSRRYRITLTGLSLDFAASAHYAYALWARELTTVPAAPWGDVAAAPVTAYAGTPVPPVVTFVAPPVVPLGSMPDAANQSHVAVDTSGITGAASVSVWWVTESRLRTAALIAPHADPGTSLPLRYLALQEAYDGLGATARRAGFTRYGTYPAGTSSVDVVLPRGSREITMFAVTAVNAAGVESAWPAGHDGLQAAVAPTVVAPSAPVVTAALEATPGTYSVTLAARCALPVAAFELYATRIPDAARDVATMGPPIQVVNVAPVPPDPSAQPPGPEVTVTLSGLPTGSDWRPLRLRAVAVAVERDDTIGAYGARSPASPVAILASPPTTPPDLSALTVHGWGPGGLGVQVAFSSDLPTDVGTLAVTARTGSTVLFTGGGPLAALPLADLSTPPSGAATGTIARGAASSGSTPYTAWFERAADSDAVDIEVVLRDALGRVTVGSAAVPGGAIDPPVITVVASRVSAPYLLAAWTTDTPADDGTGPCVLTIAGAATRTFPFAGMRTSTPFRPPIPFPPPPPVVEASFSMPDIREASAAGLRPVDVDVVRTTLGGRVTYVSAVRVPAPGGMTLTIRTPSGQVGTARIQF